MVQIKKMWGEIVTIRKSAKRAVKFEEKIWKNH